jgi:hypothetical protein
VRELADAEVAVVAEHFQALAAGAAFGEPSHQLVEPGSEFNRHLSLSLAPWGRSLCGLSLSRPSSWSCARDAGATDVQVAGDGGDARGLAPGGDEVGVFEGTRGSAAAAEASRGDLASPCLVVELAGGAEGTEVLADRACRNAELGGDLALGERTAAAPAFPVCQQLHGIDGRGRAAPAGARGVGISVHRGAFGSWR